jgi:hypothetical protein
MVRNRSTGRSGFDEAKGDAMVDQPEDAREPRDSSRLLSSLTIVMGVVAVLWGLAALPGTLRRMGSDWQQQLPTEMPVVSRSPEDLGRYVGAATCAECHPGEAAAFSRSGHAQTLRPAGRTRIAARLEGKVVEDPEQRGVLWSYHLRGGQFSVDRQEKGKSETFPIEFCFGSGRVGFTFVTTARPGSDALPVGFEHRLSYLTEGQKLGITPGQQAGANPDPWSRVVAYGRLLDEKHLLDCFVCHVTTTSNQGRGRLATATMIPNVTCERCHGPAAQHVEAARKGHDLEELRLQLGVDSASPSAQITACGECHRSPELVDITAVQPDDLQFVRFPPIGLAKSKCFRDGKSGLSCTTCHDPHTRVSTNVSAYEAICLNCHRPSGEAKTSCPVSPAKDCVGCHMPRRGPTPEFQFHDHWIRVPSGKEHAKAPSVAAGR